MKGKEFTVTVNGPKEGKPAEFIVMKEHDFHYKYTPFELYPDLYLKFCNVKAGPKSGTADLIKFLDEFGFLGIKKNVRPETAGKSFTPVPGEAVKDLLKELRDLMFAVAIWELISNKNTKGLNQVLRWEGDDLIYDYKYMESMLLASPSYKSRRLKLIDRKNIVSTANFLIKDKVNQKLSKHVTTQLLLEPSARELHGIFMVPRNLLGVIWLQFGASISTNQVIGTCANPECKKWITESKDYCSSACKQKMYRIRKKSTSKKRSKKS